MKIVADTLKTEDKMSETLKELFEKNKIPIDLEKLTDEQKKVIENKIYSEEEIKSFIPKSRFDEVNNQKKEAMTEIEKQKKDIEKLMESAKGNEELEKQLNELKLANEKKLKEFEDKENKYKADLTLQEKKNRVMLEILKLQPHDPTDVMHYIDINMINFTETGNIVGAAEQLEAIKKSRPYLFKAQGQTNLTGTKVPGEQTKANPNPNLLDLNKKEDLEKLNNASDEEYFKLRAAGLIKGIGGNK